MKVVLDTNIYIAVALHGEFAENIIDLITSDSDIELIVSEEILSEIRKKLGEKFNWADEDINLFVGKMREISQVVQISKKVDIIKRDPDDNKILECALAGKTDLIVTADQDLIKLKTFQGIGIIHPKTFSWTFPEYFKN